MWPLAKTRNTAMVWACFPASTPLEKVTFPKAEPFGHTTKSIEPFPRRPLIRKPICFSFAIIPAFSTA